MSGSNEWGPPLWHFIHALCKFNFENNEPYVTRTIQNLKALSGAIPCEKCRDHYNQSLKELDTINPRTPWVLYEWSIKLHNEINAKLGKPPFQRP